MTQKTEPGQAGQYFDEFLMEQGLYEEATASALTRVANFEKMQDAVSQRATKQINNMLAAQN